MSRSSYSQQRTEERFEEFETISQEEGLGIDTPDNPFEIEEFSIPATTSRTASDSNSSTIVELDRYAQIKPKRRRKAPFEGQEADKGVSDANQATTMTSFTVIPPIETYQAEPSQPRLPSFEGLPSPEIKPEIPEPSLFPYTQRPRDNDAADEQEVQVDQSPEAPIEASQAHTDTHAHTRETNTTGRHRCRRVHLHIYFLRRREDGVLTSRGAAFMNHVLSGLKIILILTILYYLYAKDSASPERPFQKRKLYIIHSG